MSMTYEGFYFNPAYIAIRPGAPVACLDSYQVKLLAPAWEDDGVLYMDARDVTCILSVLPEGYAGKQTGPVSVETCLSGRGCSLVKLGAIRIIRLSSGAVPSAEKLDADFGRREGDAGDYYGTYWHEGVQRPAPYRIYLPKSYDPAGKNKLLIGLHGGLGSPDSIFTNSGDLVKEYAERDGYILVAPDAVTRNSTFGCPAAPYGMPGPEPDSEHPENPRRLSEAVLRHIHMGETGLLRLLEVIRERYAVDEEQIYLMGNSMGGIGTLYFAAHHPELFRKIAPSGAVPDIRVFDYMPLKQVPQFFVAGELDSHGVCWLTEGAAAMKEAGLPIIYREVPGGTHGSAWVDVLEEIFAFFRE